MSRRVNVLLALFFLIIFANSAHRLSRAEGDYYREEVRIGAMPVWLALPVPPPDAFGPPPPPNPRPPLVIVQHGFSASRQAMRWIVDGLVRNGFAVLAADFRGHGQNPTPFNSGTLGDDIQALIRYAATRPEVDAGRIALVGHSMGAAAVYAYALTHDDVAAVVPISGSAQGGDADHPRNALLLVASGDPQRILDMSRAAMIRLGGPAEAGQPTHGDFAAGTARRFVDVQGTDHVTILFSEVPVRETVTWLRHTWGLPHTPFVAAPSGWLREGLIGVLSGLLAFFPLAGFLAGGIVRKRPAVGASQTGGVRMALVACLVAGVVLFGGTPLSFLPYIAGDQLTSFFVVAGVVYAVWLSWCRPHVPTPVLDSLRAALLGVVAFALLYMTYGAAISRLFFNLTFSPQRFWWFLLVALLYLPLGIGLESALRAPGGAASVLRSLMAKVFLVVGVVVAINLFGTLPPVVGLMVPSLVLFLPVVEAVAARLYAVSGSPVASGVLTAMLLAWLPAAIFPIGY